MQVRRFSLKTAFVVTTVLALAICCVVMGVRLRRAERQLAAAHAQTARLEASLGIVSPGDPRRVQVLAIRQLEPLRWKWRILKPRGGSVELFHRSGQLSARSLGTFDGSHWSRSALDSRDPLEIETHIYRSSDGLWLQAIRINGANSTVLLDDEMQTWLTSMPPMQFAIAGQSATEEFDPLNPITLLQTTLVDLPLAIGKPAKPGDLGGPPPSDSKSTDVPSPLLGFRIWLQIKRVP